MMKRDRTSANDGELDEIIRKTVNWGRPEIVSKWYQVDSRYKPDSEQPFLKPNEAKAAIQSLLERRENEARIEELSSWVNSYILTTGITTDPFIEAVKDRLIELEAELSQREKFAGKE